MYRKYSQIFTFVTIAALVAQSATKPFNRRGRLLKSLRLTSSGLTIRSIGTKPSTTRSVQLQCKNLYFLQIEDDGVVNGTLNKDSPNVILQLQTVGLEGLVRIYSTKTKRYIAMNNRGILNSTLTPTDETVFKYVQEPSSWHNFASAKNVNGQTMYLALRNNGQAKKGTKTARHNKSTLFNELPVLPLVPSP